MRDIVYKKVGNSAPQPIVIPKYVSTGTARFLEIIFSSLNNLGGWLNRVATDEPVEILTPVQAVLPPVKREKTRHLRKAAHAVKAKAHHAKKALKTPVGRLATVNGIALVAMFAYISSVLSPAEHTVVAAPEPTPETTTLRQFLPQTRTVERPEAFKESAAVVSSTAKTTLHAWLTPWNIQELQEQGKVYSSVSAFWLTLAENGYDITPKSSWQSWNTYRTSARKENQTLYLTISGHPNHTYLGLSDGDIQTKQIANLLALVKEHGFDGVDIDYEALGSANSDLFTNYIRNLTEVFHNENKKVAVTLEARIGNDVPMDWRNLGLLADEIRIMAYDYHAKNTGFPGPVAPLSWVKEVLDYAVTEIDPAKVVMGLGNYGYDWQQNEDQSGWSGIGVSFDQAIALAKEKNTPVIHASGIDERGYDIGVAPMFTYQDAEGKQHTVWFEDKQSLQAKVDLVSQYPIRGIIFWSVGLGDKEFWYAHSS